MKDYEHKARYHETDKMGIIHHSNYIKWYEDARINFMDILGISYKKMEEAQIISPVLEVRSEYKNMVYFDDTVIIHVDIVKYNGIRLELKYIITNKESGEIVNIGYSKHCFLHNGKIINLKKHAPNFHEMFLNASKSI
ncbi:acyl-CoA thioesterase [Anaerofustis stercorihominis]|uniref:Acyl-CoA thioester hydrolase, YbgC/YbaW family n=2 Tax=Anaerofustis stercorihominis TaxID=214853 RepID=B1CAW7_9FIRM|nr:acyl-CoA thioesterase [Anaerofustis stercorihominis]EDS71414.1 acyl-CoA thioester hydrolase, YbgC/YbaW family [Anaerofustis stercorihominis DSM 17244]MCQ4795366.1 acyl-CoA thioesterase [Anaerofustis stercorihominis]RGD73807.1 acyl-CoA thioesterase [Anaerofustis stercorihominis]